MTIIPTMFFGSPPKCDTKTSRKKKHLPDDFWDLQTRRENPVFSSSGRIFQGEGGFGSLLPSNYFTNLIRSMKFFSLDMSLVKVLVLAKSRPNRFHVCVFDLKKKCRCAHILRISSKGLKFWGRSILRSSVMNRISSIKYQTICIGCIKSAKATQLAGPVVIPRDRCHPFLCWSWWKTRNVWSNDLTLWRPNITIHQKGTVFWFLEFDFDIFGFWQ